MLESDHIWLVRTKETFISFEGTIERSCTIAMPSLPGQTIETLLYGLERQMQQRGHGSGGRDEEEVSNDVRSSLLLQHERWFEHM